MPEIVFVTIPQETVNDESVRILSWKVASGSKVEKDQQLCEVETSKAVMDIEAPEAGVVMYSAAAGDEVAVGSTICQIVPEGASILEMAQSDPVGQPVTEAAPVIILDPVRAASPSSVSEVPSDQAIEPVIADEDLAPARLTPLAAKLAAEFGFAKESFARGALVRRDDVLRRAGKLPAKAPVVPTLSTVPSTPKPASAAVVVESVENPPVAGVGVEWTDLPRRKVFEARILSQGQARAIQSQVTSSVKAPRLRARLTRLGMTSIGLGALVIFEAARLLRKYPEFNAVHDRGRIGIYSAVNVGWAIDGGQGLMVPVVPAADEKTPQEIVEIMQQQIDAYVEGKLATADFLGGTFTISDLSGDGISHFHPLISQGQSAILGVGGELNGDGEETLFLTLAFDHQLTEGRKAAQFVRELAGRLETHSALEASNVQDTAAVVEPYCALCQRDAAALHAIRAMLVKSEIPAGYVCSVCLAELS